MSKNNKKTREALDLKRRLQEATPDERAILLEGLSYEVGFGKPPRSSQFQPGQSGNPRGRPQGSKNLVTILKEELEAPIVISGNGKRRKATKWQVAIRQQVHKAAADKDTKAFAVLADLARRTGQLEAVPTVQAPPIDDRDLAAVAELVRLYDGSTPEEEDSLVKNDDRGDQETCS
ncbi:MAG: hypothetical protein HXX10_26505 [Rhodoplanes sp.]|uniref:DUF5681 domain-containing protein n=1 Tax=Rhodoplanes sp. TaxID=1968906 RepID=UPI001824354E|nr:DUF5681 domain-containing protein [Rhodoplanes sp.]NVO17596.1 hypothetical protein [Rhodoplanes sp.]